MARACAGCHAAYSQAARRLGVPVAWVIGSGLDAWEIVELLASYDARLGPCESVRTRLNTYTTFSIGCAGVWGTILLVAQRRLDAQNRTALLLVCGGWWIGWTSATIARIGFPPPKPLTPVAEERLRNVSVVLVALGLTNTIRFLATGKRREERAGRRRR